MPPEYCFWCNPDSRPAAPNEGPHATWCPAYRQSQVTDDSSLLQDIVANSMERWLARHATRLKAEIDDALRRAKTTQQSA